MSTADRYLEQIKRRVVAPAAQVARLEQDIAGHFREAAERGEPEAEVIRRLGTPDEVAAAFMTDVDLRFAGFWERLVAFFGDVGLGVMLLVPPALLCSLLAPSLDIASDTVRVLAVSAAVVLGLSALGISVLYFPVLEHLYGRTFGKRALALRVIGEQGGTVGLGAAFIRRIPMFFELLWLDALFIPFTEKKQRAFDIVAKTVVVREPDAGAGIGGWLLCFAPWLVTGLVALVALLVTAR